MNEKLQYASMLEIPVSTCQINTVPTKKKRASKKKKVNDEEIKAQLLNKINNEQELAEKEQVDFNDQTNNQEIFENAEQDGVQIESQQKSVNIHYSKNKNHKKPLKFSIVGIQLAIVGALVATILLTNLFYADSGINVFLRGVFGSENVATSDLREYDEFEPIIAMGNNEDILVEDGIISFAGEGSVYAPCDGKVSKIVKNENGKFDVEISHSQNFKSIISDIEHIYVAEGDKIYSNIPLGYLKADGANMCFTDSQGDILDDYQIVDNMVVWQA